MLLLLHLLLLSVFALTAAQHLLLHIASMTAMCDCYSYDAVVAANTHHCTLLKSTPTADTVTL